MERRCVLRGLAALMTWAPVGLLLGAADCETVREREDREFREMMFRQMSERWNAERMKQMQDEAAKRNMQLPPIGPGLPDNRSGRNAQEIKVPEIKEKL